MRRAEPNRMAGQPDLCLTFAADPVSVRGALRAALRAMAPMGLTGEQIAALELILAEVLNNIVEHAYGLGDVDMHREAAGGLAVGGLAAGGLAVGGLVPNGPESGGFAEYGLAAKALLAGHLAGNGLTVGNSAAGGPDAPGLLAGGSPEPGVVTGEGAAASLATGEETTVGLAVGGLAVGGAGLGSVGLGGRDLIDLGAGNLTAGRLSAGGLASDVPADPPGLMARFAAEPGSGQIALRIAVDRRVLQCEVADRGVPMPGGAPPAGTSAPINVAVADLPEGGFGWFLIRSLVENLTYHRDGPTNRLSFALPLDK